MPLTTDKILTKQSYKAILIHPKLPGGRAQGDLFIYNKKITIQVNELVYEIPFNKLKIEAGGASKNFVFFKEIDEHEISIYTKEKEVLQDEEIESFNCFTDDIRKTRKGINELYRGLFLFTCLCFLGLSFFYFFKGNIVHIIAESIPISWEQKIGDELFASLDNQYDFIENDSLKQVLIHEVGPIVQQAIKEGYTLDFYLIHDAEVNAFALPGGKVLINSGLLTKAGSWEEVAGVLSHEVAHVTLRHHVRGVISKLGLFTIVSFIFGDASAVAATIIDLGVHLESLSYTRSFEEEADSRGVEYLTKSNINPEGMITFFEKLEEQNKSTQFDSLLSFVSTHPTTIDRIETLKEKTAGIKNSFNSFGSNYSDYRAAIITELNQ
ncbi:M48 family metallopeptidase [Flammeovirga kamogawensis]|uniref:M48 family metallopeptidase n=1 Tax=Flammeovirga kamogawensis TaxID=373891 RepID=A0ABX8H3T1_9BACT|nr:M48 family metallopeptidase [Flammeovirga kamogawensis]MBB6461942.1 Zn-dependent protease with chaperone function [Flammeovirga kamogawensis]QWG10451.1 M48 family metallopeptidase [Flammeovirga kamogawensis]TRX63562.1 M48 family metallopeptidase [Flammeovirga kamogawensis]